MSFRSVHRQYSLYHLGAESKMKLNHLNLTVSDPLETQAFLGKYFDLKPMGKGNKNMAFLSDDNGMVLSLTNMKMGGESEVRYPTTFHIGFIQETEQRVNEINQRLKADGFDVPEPSKQHGAWTFYFLAPGGFTIEVLS
jgi:lactoylglutathione lyase